MTSSAFSHLVVFVYTSYMEDQSLYLNNVLAQMTGKLFSFGIFIAKNIRTFFIREQAMNKATFPGQ